MTDLDLEAIKHRWANVDIVPDDPCADVPLLIAELERLQRLAGPAAMPSEDAYDRMAQALADERAAVVEHCNKIELLEADRDYLLSLLTEVLATFKQVGGEPMAYAAVGLQDLARWTVARGAL